jgi:hypothetical protein
MTLPPLAIAVKADPVPDIVGVYRLDCLMAIPAQPREVPARVRAAVAPRDEVVLIDLADSPAYAALRQVR